MKVLLIAVNTQNSTAPPLGLYMLKAYYEQYSQTKRCQIKILFFKKFILSLFLQVRPEYC